mmetsp:Transcript_58263/g.137543  ORF Transcript_58263/g.137543 Transcript_58263/m.137543 type:complete len:366 (+) Transcript_58263:113-1210(+)
MICCAFLPRISVARSQEMTSYCPSQTCSALDTSGCETQRMWPSSDRTSTAASALARTRLRSMIRNDQNSAEAISSSPAEVTGSPAPLSNEATTSVAPKSDSPTMQHELHQCTLSTSSAGDLMHRKRNHPLSWKISTITPDEAWRRMVHDEPKFAEPVRNDQDVMISFEAASFSAMDSAWMVSFAASTMRAWRSAISASERIRTASLSTTLLMIRWRFGVLAGRRHVGHVSEPRSQRLRHRRQNTCCSSHVECASTSKFWQIAQRNSSFNSSAWMSETTVWSLGLSTDSSSTRVSDADGRSFGSAESSISAMFPSLGCLSRHSPSILSMRPRLKAKTPPPHRFEIETPVMSSAIMHPTAHMSSLES